MPWQTVDARPQKRRKGDAVEDAERRELRLRRTYNEAAAGHAALAAKAASALRRRLRTVVLHVFGEESADRAVKKAAEAEDMLRWGCGVVGVPTTPRGASHFELLEKIDEVERAVGIQ